MLYIRERRVWVWLAPRDGTYPCLMALSTNRKTMDGDREFAQLDRETHRGGTFDPPRRLHMTTASTITVTLNEGFFSRRNWLDWLFAAIVAVGGLYALQRYARTWISTKRAFCWAPSPAWCGWAGSGGPCAH
jgi:hypothetical protein